MIYEELDAKTRPRMTCYLKDLAWDREALKHIDSRIKQYVAKLLPAPAKAA